MPRPRVYDPDAVLDAAESLAVRSGPASVTIRALSDAVGLSNGALYHSFGSRAGLLGQVWLRAGQRVLALQLGVVEQAAHGAGALSAAAQAPADVAERPPAAGRPPRQGSPDQWGGPGWPGGRTEKG
ncbi:helix-turn-helix domain-containing protein, partial [Mycolicibacterium fortuitum]|uniref:TetR/AcrR family transcriptional regulator n=1 Tax=Mycolicibacterium fortuitum TaxID=1766 RepID=UPI0034CF7704